MPAISDMEKELKQYIDLFNKEEELFDKGSAPLLNRWRRPAAEWLETHGLPKKGSENYETFDLPSLLAPDYALNIRRVKLPLNPADSFRCGVPRMSTALFLLVNDMFGASRDAGNHLPEGVEVLPLAEASRRYPEVVGKYYNKIASPENALTALSSMLAQDGLFLRVKQDVKVTTPIQLVEILGGVKQLMTVRRVLIVMEENSEATLLICNHTDISASDHSQYLSLETVELHAAESSRLHVCDMEESSQTTRRISSWWVDMEKNSYVNLSGATLYNGLTRNEYHTCVLGPDAELSLNGMGIADGQRQISTYSFVDHQAPGGTTKELFKYSADGESVCSFTGMIRVSENAPKTEAYQSNRNLLGSTSARVYSKPQLEIYNDDVKCSHGSATGRLDEMQLFYLRTRGIDESHAKMLLRQAFMADVIEEIGIPALKERLTFMVERRFAGESAGCHDCDSDCPSAIF